MHPDYDTVTLENDIVLIKVIQSILIMYTIKQLYVMSFFSAAIPA